MILIWERKKQPLKYKRWIIRIEHLILSYRSSGIIYPTEPLVQYVGVCWGIELSNKVLLYHEQGYGFDP